MKWIEDRPDETSHLAQKLGMPDDVFEELFGRAWLADEHEPAHDFDADPSGGLGFPATPWHIAGEPPQLMIRVFPHGVFLARPVAQWSGPVALAFNPADQTYLPREELQDRAPDLVKRLLRRRRRTFRYCRYCRNLTPPERMFDAGCCMNCTDVVF